MKTSINLIIGWLMFFQIGWATSSSVYQMTDDEENQFLAIATNLNRNASAYRSIAAQRILAEANYFSERLKLPGPHPIKTFDIQSLFIGSPFFNVIKNTNFLSPVLQIYYGKIAAGGTIETTNFFFYFRTGNFSGVQNKEMNIERFDLYPAWHQTPSLISSNGAYQLATQWLALVDVNVAVLEKKYGAQMKIEQAFFWNPPGTTNKAMLPVYNVTWGDDSNGEYPAKVQVLGTKKELMALHLSDFSLSRHPPLIISSVDGLEKYLKDQTNLPIMRLQRPDLHFTNSPAPSDFHQENLL